MLALGPHPARPHVDADRGGHRPQRHARASDEGFALHSLTAEPLDLGHARGMRGSGWDADLDEVRAARTG